MSSLFPDSHEPDSKTMSQENNDDRRLFVILFVCIKSIETEKKKRSDVPTRFPIFRVVPGTNWASSLHFTSNLTDILELSRKFRS